MRPLCLPVLLNDDGNRRHSLPDNIGYQLVSSFYGQHQFGGCSEPRVTVMFDFQETIVDKTLLIAGLVKEKQMVCRGW
jgi:hypothetical protein